MQGRLTKTFLLVLLFGLIGGAALLVNFSATPASAQQPRSREFPPHLGDLMNEAMQVHHTKLWLAAHANNWPLAAYQVKKLKDTMEEIKEAIVYIQTASPKWQSVPVGEMLQSIDSHLENLGASREGEESGQIRNRLQRTYRRMQRLPRARRRAANQDYPAGRRQHFYRSGLHAGRRPAVTG